jgi:predicted kinase
VSRTDERSLPSDQPAGSPANEPRSSANDAPHPVLAQSDRPPRPYSREDLQQRLEQFPPGHPSSPRNADGSRKPPPPRLRDLELPMPGEDLDLEDFDGDGYGPPDQRETKPDRCEPLTDAEHSERASGIDDRLDGDGDVPARPDRPEATSGRCEPLTDAEHAEHIRYVEKRLDWARREGLATDIRFTTDPDREQWTPDRAALHREILDELYERAASVPCDHKAIMAGGLGGAGKSTVLGEHAGIDSSQYLTINPDDIKELMAERGLVPEVEGLSPMEASDLIHEESSYLAKQLALHAIADGKNVVWDITMSNRGSVESRLDDLDREGYATTGVFVHIPVEVSVQRADDRYRHGHEDYRNGEGQGGRYVPPEMIRSQAEPEWGSVNRRTFEEVKDRFDDWSVYDNSVYGRAPILVASGSKTQGIREEA